MKHTRWLSVGLPAWKVRLVSVLLSCALTPVGIAWPRALLHGQGSYLEHAREAHALVVCGAASVEGAPCVCPPVVCAETCRDRVAQGTAAWEGKLPGARA